MLKDHYLIGSGLKGRSVTVKSNLNNIYTGFVADADYGKGITIKDFDRGIDVLCLNKETFSRLIFNGSYFDHWQYIRTCIMEGTSINEVDIVANFGLKPLKRLNYAKMPGCAFE